MMFYIYIQIAVIAFINRTLVSIISPLMTTQISFQKNIKLYIYINKFQTISKKKNCLMVNHFL